MKKLLLVIIVAVVVYIFYGDKKSDVVESREDKKTETKVLDKTKPNSLNTKTTDSNTTKTAAKTSTRQAPTTEEESLNYFCNTLKEFANVKKTGQELINNLESMGLIPVVKDDDNGATGKMRVIRASNAFVGTRYFHAQYFGDSQDEAHLQHMSFEFRPGEDSFERALKIVRAEFNLPKKMKIDQDNLKAWSIADGYIVWVKKLNKTDLENDPFNAYTDGDVGTVRVAVELDPHADGQEEHTH